MKYLRYAATALSLAIITPSLAQPTFTVYKSQSQTSGATIVPTWDRLNTWDKSMTNPLAPYPAFHYPFFNESPLMTATGGRGIEMYRPDGTYDFSSLYMAIQNLLNQNIKPIIVIGNTPETISKMPGEKGAFDANVGAPNDYNLYYKYIKALTQGVYGRFTSQFSSLRFRLYTEPDNYDWWAEGFDSYQQLYDVTLGAMRDALKPNGITPILDPGNLLAPQETPSFPKFWPWTRPLAQWLAEPYTGKTIESFNGNLSNWTLTGSASIISGEMKLASSRALSNTFLAWSDFRYSFDMRSPVNGGASWKVGWAIFKYVDDGNYFYALLHDDGGTLELGRIQGGVSQSLGTAATGLPPTSTRNFCIRSFCDTIEVRVDGKVYLRKYVANSGAGKAGFWAWDGAPDVRVDNVIAEPYMLADNFATAANWTASGSFLRSGGTATLGTSASIISTTGFTNYKFKASMRTVTPGNATWKTGWVVFDYTDLNNYSAFLLHTDGFIEYGFTKNGVWTPTGKSWTGLPRPFLSEDFNDNTVKRLEVISGSAAVAGGELRMNAAKVLGGYENTYFTHSFRYRASMQTVTQGPDAASVGWLIFKYQDDNNYWAVVLQNDANRSLTLMRRSNGVNTDMATTSLPTNTTSGGKHSFDISVGGEWGPLATGGVGWTETANLVTVKVDGIQYIGGTYSGGTTFGRIGAWAWNGASDVRLDDVLVTYEKSPLLPSDYHDYVVTSFGATKTLSIDGVNYAVMDRPGDFSSGRVGFFAWDGASNVQVRNVCVSAIVPGHAAAIPRFPSGQNPEFSFSSYGSLGIPIDLQMGSDPRGMGAIMSDIKSKVSPYFPSAKYSVGEGDLYHDEANIVLWSGEGTHVGAAWNAALVKQSLDAGLSKYTQWGYSTENLKSPVYNVFQLLEMMRNNTRIRVVTPSGLPDYMDAFASRSGDKIKILVFNYNKDRNLNTSMTFKLDLRELLSSRNYWVDKYEVSATKSNFFTKWLQYTASQNLQPKSGFSRYDMYIPGAYVTTTQWNTKKAIYDANGDDELGAKTQASMTTTSTGTAVLTNLIMTTNCVRYFEIYPK